MASEQQIILDLNEVKTDQLAYILEQVLDEIMRREIGVGDSWPDIPPMESANRCKRFSHAFVGVRPIMAMGALVLAQFNGDAKDQADGE
jgi:hypothetical protein